MPDTLDDQQKGQVLSLWFYACAVSRVYYLALVRGCVNVRCVPWNIARNFAAENAVQGSAFKCQDAFIMLARKTKTEKKHQTQTLPRRTESAL